MTGLPTCDLFGTSLERALAGSGRPAAGVPYDGMPAYESATGALLVMECLVVNISGRVDSLAPMLFPRSYGMTALRAPSDLAALHDDPDAIWSWRPILYRLMARHTERMGSQQELGWRRGLADAVARAAEHREEVGAFLLRQVAYLKKRYGDPVPLADPLARRDGYRRARKNTRKRLYREYVAFVEALPNVEEAPLPFQEANERARTLLLEHLAPQQRLDLLARGAFYARGEINRLYEIRPGNGLSIVDPETRRESVSICLHTDDWIPDDDNALAAKLLIEAGRRGEQELLEGGRATALLGRNRPATPEDRAAWERERHLLPAPLATE